MMSSSSHTPNQIERRLLVDPDLLAVSKGEDKRIVKQTILKLTALLQGRYKETDLDKKKITLSGLNIQSIRLNDTYRLLLTTININHLQIFYVVAPPDPHKYRLLKNNEKLQQIAKLIQDFKVTGKYPKDNLKLFKLAALENMLTETATTDESQLEPSVDFSHLEYNDGQVIEITDKQSDIISQKLPLLLSGLPGASKTFLLEQILKEYLANNTQNLNAPIYFITQSHNLAKQIRQRFESSEAGRNDTNKRVKILSTLDFLFSVENAMCTTYKLVGENDFNEWIKEVTKETKRQQNMRAKAHEENIAQLSDAFFDEGHKFYEELRILCGYSKEAYLALGKGHSLFPEIKERAWLYQVYERYLKKCKDDKKYNPSFVKLNLENVAELVLLDEMQDLSFRQIEDFLALAQNGNVLGTIDSNQSLYDTISKTSFILAKLRKKSPYAKHIALEGTFRCTEQAKEVANVLLRIKRYLIGANDKEAIPEITVSNKQVPHEDKICFLTPAIAATNSAHFKRLAAKGELAIIIPEISSPKRESMEQDLRHLFGSDLIFTVAEIKGGQYPYIIAIDLLSNEHIKSINNELRDNNVDLETLKNTSKHRSKNKIIDTRYAKYLNHAITGFTRAEDTFFIFEQNINHDNHTILKLLQNGCDHTFEMPNYLTSDDPNQDVEKPLSIIEITKCINLIKRLVDEGNIKQAKAFYINRLKKKEEDFDAFLQKNNRQPYFIGMPNAPYMSPIAEYENKRNENLVKKVNNKLRPLQYTNEQFLIDASKTLAGQPSSVEFFFERIFNHHDPIYCLFNLNVGNDKNLFDTMLEIGKCLPIFQSQLTNITLESMIKKGKLGLCETYSLLSNQNINIANYNVDFILALLEKKCGLRLYLIYDLKDHLLYEHSEKYTPFLPYLMQTNNGLPLIKTLLHSAQLIKSFVSKLNCNITYKGRLLPFLHYYFMICFANNFNPAYDCYRLFQAFPEFIPQITHDMLYTRIEIGTKMRHSLFFYLLLDKKYGTQTLDLIFKNNPNLLKATADNLYLKKGDVFSLFMLSFLSKDRELLFNILTHNIDLLQNITTEHLCRIYDADLVNLSKTHTLAPHTPLLMHKSGLNIIRCIASDKTIKQYEQVFETHRKKRQLKNADTYGHICPLLYLSHSHIGMAILDLLVKHVKTLKKAIPFDIWKGYSYPMVLDVDCEIADASSQINTIVLSDITTIFHNNRSQNKKMVDAAAITNFGLFAEDTQATNQSYSKPLPPKM